MEYTCLRLLRRRPRPTRLEILSALLKPSGDIAYSAAKSHLGFKSGAVADRWKQSGFPHDSAAIAAFRRLDATKPALVHVDSRKSPVLPNATVVASGSPVSSDDARLFLAYRNLNDSRDAIVSNTFRPELLPYHFVIGNEKTIQVRSGMMGGIWQSKFAHSLEITRTGKLWQPRHYVDSEGRLSTDFLLVSRLPRSRSGGDVVLITGAHGVGAEAFALLFDEKAFPTSQLLALHDTIAGARYFQFVLECTKISHDGEMSVAHKLSICGDCPPQIVEFSPDLFQGV